MIQIKAHLPFLDGMRGAAILQVFLLHSVGTAFGWEHVSVYHGLFRDFHVSWPLLLLMPFTYGYLGVAVFFAVSGFCIHLSHVQSGETGWEKFVVRRFFRIYPCYLLTIIFCLGLGLVGSLKDGENVFDLVTHLFAIHNLFASTFFGINGSFWSIAVEIQLYALYPLFFWMACKWGWGKSLLIVGFVEGALRIADVFGSQMPFWVLKSPFAFWFSWCLGAFVSECFVKGRMNILNTIRFDLLFLVLFAACLFGPLGAFQFPLVSLMTCVAFGRLICGKWRTPDCGLFGAIWKHLSFLGKISFAFYLFHQPVIEMSVDPLLRYHRLKLFLGHYLPVEKLDFSQADPLIKLLVCILSYPLILALSFLIYRTLEKPAILVGKTLINRACVA